MGKASAYRRPLDRPDRPTRPYGHQVLEQLPLFPLGLVLFPGLVLPLHVFEERYRVLIRDLLDLPESERRFGVVTIRQGREVGSDGIPGLYDVGCVAQLRQVEPQDDGRFEILTLGVQRFALASVHDDRPYLTGRVELLADEPGEDAETLAAAVQLAFWDYVAALAEAGGENIEVAELPSDPQVLSYLVAATVLLDLPDRQTLLAKVDGAARLRAELTLLRREAVLLRTLAAAPAPELAGGPVNLN